MNILYISCVCGHSDAGPNFSIPASIKAQSRLDNVLWINTVDVYREEWIELPFFHNLKEFRKLRLKYLPVPFSCPDMVVFEELYNIKAVAFAKELKANSIPYIIVPRGSMTIQAFNNNSKWKKVLTHPLFFDSFIKGASLIQYLSDEEWNNTRKFKDLPHIVIPNGIVNSGALKNVFSIGKIEGIFIGRLDVYQKGLDILTQSIILQKSFLRENHFKLKIYGTEKAGLDELKKTISKAGVKDLIEINGPIFGEQKKEVLLNSDVFFLTSRSEGHPMGLIEALNYGLPAFVTTGTGMKRKIEEAKCGWGCELDIQEMSNTLITMINSKSQYPNMSLAARKLSEKFEWTKIADDFHKIIINTIYVKGERR